MTGESSHGSSGNSAAVCSCPGDCAALSISTLPPSPLLIEAATADFDEPAISHDALQRLERSDLVLPFAIGPPAITA